MVSTYFIHIMRINHIDSLDKSNAAAYGLAIDTDNPVHLLYAGAAVVTGATVITAVGVTTVAAPGLVIAPICAAAAMAAGGSFINDRRSAALDDASATPVADVTPVSA